ncbi:unnamed protein product [Candida verbasci]|uniref:Sfi1 spindle body domain-containing protein n=1 Tax=Candida verbasci TaxID=1227364 RepID=A0A9W4TUX4_9ASCO|nr:unnamed protein product [Candida verbasci]
MSLSKLHDFKQWQPIIEYEKLLNDFLSTTNITSYEIHFKSRKTYNTLSVHYTTTTVDFKDEYFEQEINQFLDQGSIISDDPLFNDLYNKSPSPSTALNKFKEIKQVFTFSKEDILLLLLPRAYININKRSIEEFNMKDSLTSYVNDLITVGIDVDAEFPKLFHHYQNFIEVVLPTKVLEQDYKFLDYINQILQAFKQFQQGQYKGSIELAIQEFKNLQKFLLKGNHLINSTLCMRASSFDYYKSKSIKEITLSGWTNKYKHLNQEFKSKAYFNFWKNQVVLKQYIYERSCLFYDQLLESRYLDCWTAKNNKFEKLEHQADLIYLRKYFARLKLDNESVADEMFMKKFFIKWRSKIDIKENYSPFLRRYFEIWRSKLSTEAKVDGIVHIHDANLVRSSFTNWKYQFELVQLANKFINKANERIKKDLLLEWQQKSTLNKIATNFRNKKLKQRTFHLWSKCHKLFKIEYQFTSKHNQNLLQRCMTNWIKTWDYRSLETQAEELHKRRLAEKYFTKLKKYNLVGSIELTSLKRKYFNIMISRYNEIQTLNKIPAILLLRKWRDKLETILEQNDAAGDIYQFNLKKSLFSLWFQELVKVDEMIIAADEVNSNKDVELGQQILRKWSLTAQKNSIHQKIFQDFSKKLNYNTKKSFFQLWHYKINQTKEDLSPLSKRNLSKSPLRTPRRNSPSTLQQSVKKLKENKIIAFRDHFRSTIPKLEFEDDVSSAKRQGKIKPMSFPISSDDSPVKFRYQK